MSEVVALSASDARALTDQIKTSVEVTWELVKRAFLGRAWEQLGYSSWDDYCTREFGTSRIRLPREERQEVVASMREIGMSTRAIASATGISKDTAARALSGVANETPGPVTGTDGKTYTPRPAPEPSPLPPGFNPGDLDELNTPAPAPAPEPASPTPPRRRPYEEQFFHAIERLNSAIVTLTNLGEDDRLSRNKEKVARYRNDLRLAVEALQRLDNHLN